MKLIDLLAAIAVPIIWGSNISIIKTAVAEFPPIFLIGLRFLLVATLLIWWVPLPRKQLPMLALLSCAFGSLHFGCIFFGLREVDASTVAILSMAGVPFSVLFARMILQERFGLRKIVGMVIAFGGVVLLFGEPSIMASPLHLAVVVIGVIAWGLGNTLIKLVGPISPFTMNAWMGLFASVQLLALSTVVETGQVAALTNASGKAWLCLLFLVVVTTIGAYGLWYYLIGKYDVNKVVPFNLLTPIFGVGAGAFFLGEPLTWLKLVGGVITLAGVAIIQLRWRKPYGRPALPVNPRL